MATGGDAATQLASLLLPLVTSKKTVNTVPSNVTNNFNQLMSTLLPQAQTSTVSQENLDALLQSVMSQASRSFAPNKAVQNQAGMYNSSSLDFMRNDASAKATEQAMQAMINAQLAGQQQQLNAAQIASQLNSQMGQLAGTQTVPAQLGGLAGPAAAYALYKYMMPSAGGKAAGSVGKLMDVASSAGATSQAATGANKLSLAAPSSSVGSSALGFDYSAPADLSLAAPTSNFGLSDLSAANFNIGDGMGDISTAFSDLSSGSSLSQLGGTTDAVSNFDSAVGGLADFVGGIPIIGDSLSGITSEVGKAASGISDFFTPEVNIPGFGTTGIPILAGLGNFLEGDIMEGVGNVGGAWAGNAAGSALGSSLGGNLGWLAGPIGGILGSIFGGKLFSKCYITTAVMSATGDDSDTSYPLETLRRYRDEFMAATPAGQELIQNYYDVAPVVVAKLSAREDSKDIYNYFYHRYIVPAVKQIEAGDNYAALTTYREMSQFAEMIANSEEAPQHAY